MRKVCDNRIKPFYLVQSQIVWLVDNLEFCGTFGVVFSDIPSATRP